MSITKISRPDISQLTIRLALPERNTPYYDLVAYSRHIGYLRDSRGDAWYARIRTRAGSYYRRRLGFAWSDQRVTGLTYERALDAANAWFSSAGIRPWAAEVKHIGVRQELVICPTPGPYSVAHAMHDYVEWKRLAAAKSHFQTNLSLINHHIIPRLANVPLAQFSGEHLRVFVRQVLETQPKRGNQALGAKRSIDSLSDEELRKRKKTVNTLVGILRVAFQIAWENGKTDSERSWRCLRRLPAVDRPRT
ncbi:MAG: site-specific integrase, partial [Oxalobacteraceae bacterium]